VQSFFRQAVLASYEEKCAMCSLGLRRLLTAGHIIPWSVSRERRADPTNGLALCSLHERAFDTGLLAVDDSMRVMVAAAARCNRPPPVHRVALLEIEGSRLVRPRRFAPDPTALAWHRENVFGRDRATTGKNKGAV
jgi:predicted restriction endonuclease